MLVFTLYIVAAILFADCTGCIDDRVVWVCYVALCATTTQASST